MMTLKKLTAGDGYTYLTRHIAGGDVDRERGQDAAEYYTQRGNPPGRWAGRGLGQLGLSGEVTEAQMKHLFGQGMHPDADRIIAEYLAEHSKPGMTGEQLGALTKKAVRQATLGRRLPVYATLEEFDARVSGRLQLIAAETGREPTPAEIGKIRSEEARRARGAVAGYDLVFTPVKSLVLLWALDERQWVRDGVRRAHEEARDSALRLLEEHAAYTRTGDTGQAQIATHGLIYTVFDHYDSRDGDPNLHTHIPVSNKIKGVDGKWRSLDGTGLYRVGVAASEHYNSTIETLATQYLGVSFEVRPDTAHKRHPVREIAGMPLEFVKTFSSRRGQIEARYEQLIVDFRRAHGRDPDTQAAFSLAEQANLDTRGPKPLPRSLAGLRAEWTQRLTAEHGRSALRALAKTVTARGPESVLATFSTELSTVDIGTLAQQAVGHTEASRSTWTVWNLRAEADRMLRQPSKTLFPQGIAFATAADRDTVLDRIVAQAITDVCVPVTVQPDLIEPAMLRRADGESVFVPHASARFTSRGILDAEQRLLLAAQTPVTLGSAALAVHAILDGYEATHSKTLDPGQREMVVAFTIDPRLIAVGLGPAGAGKTTTMHAFRHVLAAQGQRLIPLATSAASAAVLSADLGVPAENVHKFVYEHLTKPQQPAGRSSVNSSPEGFFRVKAGDVILVDEAGLAGTRNLDTLRDIATRHGATIRLLGDYRQLSAVESGGALRLIATEVGAVELTDLHRFATAAEADVTRRLRSGDTSALDFYADQDRIKGGSVEAMIEQAYNGWHADMTAGLKTLMSSSTTEGVTALSARARADRIAAGHVESAGVALHDGNLAGRGDWIVTRDNDRTMTCNRGKDWVRNGDAWTVTARNSNGSLKVKHMVHGGTVTLPAAYVGSHVELLYATTTHRAQGATVDTAHALVTNDMTRENLYVAASRARLRTMLYAVTHRILPLDEDARMDRTVYDRHARDAREVLETVLATEGAQPSATEAIALAKQKALSLSTVLPRWRYTAEIADQARLSSLIDEVLGDQAAGLSTQSGWPAVMHTLRMIEAQGWDLRQVLAGTARYGSLTGVDEPAQLLAWRIKDHIDGRVPVAALAAPTADDAARYAALVRPYLHTPPVLNPAQATQVPRLLHTDPVTGRADYQQLLAVVVGDRDAQRAASEAAWPALRAVIRRVETAGHDPLTAITAAVLARPLHDAHSLSEVLVWRMNRTLNTTPAPVEPSAADTWRALAWTLKAAENSGGNVAEMLAPAKPGTDLDGIRHHINQLTAPTAAAGVLPWLTPTPVCGHTELDRFLGDADALIQQRVHERTMHAIVQQPAWVAGLGAAPSTPAEYTAWMSHVGVVAAFRDQYEVSLDDPAQPLGAYLPAHHGGHEAYLHAANAVLSTRRPGQAPADPVTARVAADIYLALPDTDRDAITTAIATTLGPDWLGPRHGDADTLLTAPFYAAHLHAQLAARGHLSPLRETPAAPNSGTAPQPALTRTVGLQAPMDRPVPQPGLEIGW